MERGVGGSASDLAAGALLDQAALQLEQHQVAR